MHPAIIIGTLIVDVAMGQIPRSTERISSYKSVINCCSILLVNTPIPVSFFYQKQLLA